MADVDLNKVVRQHLEMDGFFTGFALRSQTAARDRSAPAAGGPGVVAPSVPAREAAKTQLAAEVQAVIPQPPSGLPRSACSDMIRNPRSSAEAAAELAAVAAEAGQCRKCQLGSSRRNCVPGEGHSRARIMFVGEAPGADEDAQGRPFVGRAGQLLDKIIAACGLRREEVFIGNILKCRPPENRDPRPDEIINCLPYLQRQVEAISPEIIVALGGHAAKTLLNTVRPIGQLRGQFHEYCPGLGLRPVKLMATFHPAYLLRNYSEQNRRYVWEDMKRVLTELGLPIPERDKN